VFFFCFHSKLPEVFDPSFDFTTADWKTAKINETLINYVRTDKGYAVCEGDILLPIKQDEFVNIWLFLLFSFLWIFKLMIFLGYLYKGKFMGKWDCPLYI
jgi:hypothetical protein